MATKREMLNEARDKSIKIIRLEYKNNYNNINWEYSRKLLYDLRKLLKEVQKENGKK